MFDGSGSRFAAVTGTGARVWDTRSGRQVAGLDGRGVRSASFSGDGSFLATADGQEIRVWRLTPPGAPVFRHSLDNQHLYGAPAWDPDRPVLRYLEGGTVHALDLAAAVTSAWRDRLLDDVRLSPDGRTYANAERSGTRYLFQLRATGDGHPLHTLPPVPVPVSRDPSAPVAPGDTVPLMAFSSDGRVFAYGVSAPGRDADARRFTVWDLHRDRTRSTLDLAGPAVVSITLGPGGGTLYAARVPPVGKLSDEVWDTDHQRRTAVLTGLASSLAVRPDGRLLLGDGRVARLPSGRVGDTTSSRATRSVPWPSLDGSLLAAGDQTGRVALWDGNPRHRAGVLRNVFPAPLGEAAEAVSALALSPDGRTLAVGGDAGSVQPWDVATRQPLGGPLTTPGESIDSLAFAPDGTTLYAGSPHVPLQRYVVDPERAVTEVCARTGSTGLTRTQWHTYVPDAPYRRICGDAASPG
ncbi:hypothetical protein [Streptomyces sp. NPDC000877]|uniref:WD40 repeat domain-containing protein n=1 Tax=unclassified Streptomyces TaxID=2593676 RepID=UPI003322684D